MKYYASVGNAVFKIGLLQEQSSAIGKNGRQGREGQEWSTNDFGERSTNSGRRVQLFSVRAISLEKSEMFIQEPDKKAWTNFEIELFNCSPHLLPKSSSIQPHCDARRCPPQEKPFRLGHHTGRGGFDLRLWLDKCYILAAVHIAWLPQIQTIIIQLNYIVTFDLSTICHQSDLLQFSCDDDLIWYVPERLRIANKELPWFFYIVCGVTKNITAKMLSHQTNKKQLYPAQLAFFRAECIQLQPWNLLSVIF